MTTGDTRAAVDFVLERLDRRALLAESAAMGMKKVEALLDVYRSALKDVFMQALSNRGAISRA